VFVFALTLAPVFAEQERSRTTWDGIYTVDQAERGKQSYQRACAQCHPLDWYRGDTMRPWDGAPLKNLYDVIATTMPPANPASLKGAEYVALLAYILSLNEMPAGGEELPASPDALEKILIKWRKNP